MTANTAFYTLFILTLLLLKHFFADWFFQSSEMAAKKGTDLRWLARHCAIHISGTALVLFPFLTPLQLIAIFTVEFFVHGGIDWTKGRPQLARRFPMPGHDFWVLIGADQLAHQLFYIAITAWIVSYAG